MPVPVIFLFSLLVSLRYILCFLVSFWRSYCFVFDFPNIVGSLCFRSGINRGDGVVRPHITLCSRMGSSTLIYQTAVHDASLD